MIKEDKELIASLKACLHNTKGLTKKEQRELKNNIPKVIEKIEKRGKNEK